MWEGRETHCDLYNKPLCESAHMSARAQQCSAVTREIPAASRDRRQSGKEEWREENCLLASNNTLKRQGKHQYKLESTR